MTDGIESRKPAFVTPATRLYRIEAILRANELHEPSCAFIEGQCKTPGCAVYHYPQACDCWLSEPEQSP